MQAAWVVDAFSDRLYQGNPAGVVMLDDAFPPTGQMQALATRLALPTTAFVIGRQPGDYAIRWFTPGAELNICGHATIATMAYLYEVEQVRASGPLRFHTHAGPLHAHREGELMFLDLPTMRAMPAAPPARLQAALGATIRHFTRAVDDFLVLLDSEETVSGLAPDFDALKRFDCRGHIVTAPSGRAGVDFVSRSFFPALGVDEDQVCVSAHCKLAPFWAERLGRRRLSALQVSPRGGRLIVEEAGDRVRVAGTAVVRERLAL
ncbi:PhzF family phenazine biosynthesis protein [Paraburkholderia sp. A1RI_3L]|uniref:PhzF family phenazine biosynthesis protein n=1 Tax=Paraburkholderia TaxID=1822464 RepID=UPI003B7D2E5A